MGGFRSIETGLAQCRRGKHVYSRKEKASYFQTCLRCGAGVHRRSRWKNGRDSYGPHRKH